MKGKERKEKGKEKERKRKRVRCSRATRRCVRAYGIVFVMFVVRIEGMYPDPGSGSGSS